MSFADQIRGFDLPTFTADATDPINELGEISYLQGDYAGVKKVALIVVVALAVIKVLIWVTTAIINIFSIMFSSSNGVDDVPGPEKEGSVNNDNNDGTGSDKVDGFDDEVASNPEEKKEGSVNNDNNDGTGSDKVDGSDDKVASNPEEKKEGSVNNDNNDGTGSDKVDGSDDKVASNPEEEKEGSVNNDNNDGTGSDKVDGFDDEVASNPEEKKEGSVNNDNNDVVIEGQNRAGAQPTSLVGDVKTEENKKGVNTRVSNVAAVAGLRSPSATHSPLFTGASSTPGRKGEVGSHVKDEAPGCKEDPKNRGNTMNEDAGTGVSTSALLEDSTIIEENDGNAPGEVNKSLTDSFAAGVIASIVDGDADDDKQSGSGMAAAVIDAGNKGKEADAPKIENGKGKGSTGTPKKGKKKRKK